MLPGTGANVRGIERPNLIRSNKFPVEKAGRRRYGSSRSRSLALAFGGTR